MFLCKTLKNDEEEENKPFGTNERKIYMLSYIFINMAEKKFPISNMKYSDGKMIWF